MLVEVTLKGTSCRQGWSLDLRISLTSNEFDVHNAVNCKYKCKIYWPRSLVYSAVLLQCYINLVITLYRVDDALIDAVWNTSNCKSYQTALNWNDIYIYNNVLPRLAFLYFTSVFLFFFKTWIEMML